MLFKNQGDKRGLEVSIGTYCEWAVVWEGWDKLCLSLVLDGAVWYGASGFGGVTSHGRTVCVSLLRVLGFAVPGL